MVDRGPLRKAEIGQKNTNRAFLVSPDSERCRLPRPAPLAEGGLNDLSCSCIGCFEAICRTVDVSFFTGYLKALLSSLDAKPRSTRT
jgi:hypothetical protein